jgi:hypothetical protein
MIEPTHAPGWRGRPRRYGPIEEAYQGDRLERVERAFQWTCYMMGTGVVALAAYAWGIDALAGHIR